MAVKLRIKKNKETSSFYLDIHSDGKRQPKEFLPGLFIYNKPKSPEQRVHNEEIKSIAEGIRSKRQLAYIHETNQIEGAFKQDAEMLPYFEKFLEGYANVDKSKVSAMIEKFKERFGNSPLFRQVNENFVADFKNYLENKVSGPTAKAYFLKFRQVLRRARVDKLCRYNVKEFEDTRFDIDDSILQKETLETAEIQKLANAEAQNPTIKAAFLFCCFTGFDFADVFELKWSHIQKDGIRKPREKTANRRLMPIHETTAAILASQNPKTEFVFQDLPNRENRRYSHGACNKNLKALVKRAGIGKHITFHCGRHTFGTLAEGDDRVIAQLLGHKGIRQVATYRRTKDAKLRASVDSLPAIHIPK